MKRAIQPTSIERKMRENDFIVSKTNPKGIITYGNPIFIEFSGYTEAELLGSQRMGAVLREMVAEGIVL